MTDCENCCYNNYDELSQSYYCDANMDEDEVARLATRGSDKACPYYRNYDEYQVVRHQI